MKIDNTELDRLIEDAVVENAAKKQLMDMEIRLREKEKKQRRRRSIWIAGGICTAAAAAVVAAAVLPFREKSAVPDTPLAVKVSPESDSTDVKDAPVSAGDRAKAACRSYIASIEPYRSDYGFEEETGRAIALLKEGKPADALAALQKTEQAVDSRLAAMEGNDDDSFAEMTGLENLKEDIGWYKALALLSSGDIDAARPLLEKQEESGGEHSAEARDILREVYGNR